jgi:phosphoglycolate phosphatase-like HAD superfamily hydrolase
MNQPEIWHNYDTILWDFDGVILDSMSVRDKGFELVLDHFEPEHVAQLLDFHRRNGGLSRYVKFRYFYEEILKEELSDERLAELAQSFSDIMLNELGNPDLLMADTHAFLQSAISRFRMHVVSGSDQKELRQLCDQLNLTRFFQSIHGSPTPKTELVRNLLIGHQYEPERTVLIGDSGNDLDAARDNGIAFIGYNNDKLRETADHYIEQFQPLY